MAVGVFLVLDWADDQTPWVSRSLLILFATLIGYRVGRAVFKDNPTGRRPNWRALAVAALACGVAVYFGAVRPVTRAAAFAAHLDDLRASTDALTALAAEIPEPGGKADAERFRHFHARLAAEADQAAERADRMFAQRNRFTPDQQVELAAETRRLTEALAVAKAKLQRLVANKPL
jgi:hypothetical protein